ncbi:MAG: M20 metallopeptidase family protein [Stackebrandtia sp.]
MSQLERRSLSRRVLLGAATVAGAAAVTTPALIAAADDGPSAKRLDQSALDKAASRLDGDLVELRRDIHAHPEVAGQEERTAGIVADRLRKAGLAVTTNVGGYGVVGVLKGARPGRTVAYRADMDAVPADEQIPGGSKAAHKCGHDIHTTVGIGVAEVLAGLRDRLAGTVVFVFQPAEEALTGAKAMLDDEKFDEVFDKTSPEEIHALHCGPYPVGEFATMPGFGLPGQDMGTVTLTGPDAAANAKRLAGEIGELTTVAPPESSAEIEQLVADVQEPDSPLAEFLYMRAKVEGSGEKVTVPLVYRCWPEERSADVRDEVRRLAQAYDGATVDFPKDPFPAMVVPEKEGKAVKRFLRKALGDDKVRTQHASFPFNGEDFALFQHELPGTFTFLGVGKPGADIKAYYPHFTDFDPDERAIGHGVRAMAGLLAYRAAKR